MALCVSGVRGGYTTPSTGLALRVIHCHDQAFVIPFMYPLGLCCTVLDRHPSVFSVPCSVSDFGRAQR